MNSESDAHRSPMLTEYTVEMRRSHPVLSDAGLAWLHRVPRQVSTDRTAAIRQSGASALWQLFPQLDGQRHAGYHKPLVVLYWSELSKPINSAIRCLLMTRSLVSNIFSID